MNLGDGGVLVSDSKAEEHGWGVGETLTMRFAKTGERRIRIDGTYTDAPSRTRASSCPLPTSTPTTPTRWTSECWPPLAAVARWSRRGQREQVVGASSIRRSPRRPVGGTTRQPARLDRTRLSNPPMGQRSGGLTRLDANGALDAGSRGPLGQRERSVRSGRRVDRSAFARVRATGTSDGTCGARTPDARSATNPSTGGAFVLLAGPSSAPRRVCGPGASARRGRRITAASGTARRRAHPA